MKVNDFQFTNHGSLFLVHPLTDEADQWLQETAPEDALYWGRALVVEPRYVAGVLDAIAGGCHAAV